MQRGYVFRLIPTHEQEQYFWNASGAARFIYNWALETKQKAYNEQNISLSGYDLCKMLTQLKKKPDYAWLNEIHNKVLKKAVLDCSDAFDRMFKGKSRHPKFKSKRNTTPSFYIETSIQNKGMILKSDGTLEEKCNSYIKFFNDNTVQLSGIGRVRLSNNAKNWNLPYLTENNIKVCNGRIKFDGLHWNLSFSLDVPEQHIKTTEEVIGIDLGIKDTAICSDNTVYKNINKTSERIKKLEKRKKRYQRCISRKYEANKIKDTSGKTKYIKTNNIKKLEKKTAKIDRTLKNIRKTYNHKISREIVNKRPKAIVMENLNIRGMMKNKHLSKAIQQQCLYELKTYIKYKAESQGTLFIEAPRNYKSTQTCSQCGSIQKMNLSQRTYICPICGHTEDRDLNASHNLQNYGLSLLQA